MKTSEKANVHNRTGLHMLFTSVAQTLHELYTSIETTSKRILVAQPINYHTCVVRRGLCICALSVLLSQQRQQIPEGNWMPLFLSRQVWGKPGNLKTPSRSSPSGGPVNPLNLLDGMLKVFCWPFWNASVWFFWHHLHPAIPRGEIYDIFQVLAIPRGIHPR